MSIYNIPLLDTQQTVERTIFHSIRKHCVSRGYTPDITTIPSTPAGYQQYLDALATIKQNIGYAIEVFNSGPPNERELKQVPRIVLDTQGFVPGTIGGDQGQQYTEIINSDGTASYYSDIMPPTTANLYFNIHVLAANSTQERIMNAIISLAVPRKGYLEIYKETPDGEIDYLFTNFLSYVPVREFSSPGIMETIARYMCPDLTEINHIPVAQNISPLKYMEVQVEQDDYTKLELFKTGELPE
jgi:hypothetical protein